MTKKRIYKKLTKRDSIAYQGFRQNVPSQRISHVINIWGKLFKKFNLVNPIK